MDEVVSKLESLTNEFVKDLETSDVDSIVRFVEERQVLIDEFAKLRDEAVTLPTPAEGQTEEQATALRKQADQKIADRLKHILSYDALINDKMQHLMDQSMTKVNKINQSKKREQAYNPAYSPDSLYFDKKK